MSMSFLACKIIVGMGVLLIGAHCLNLPNNSLLAVGNCIEFNQTRTSSFCTGIIDFDFFISSSDSEQSLHNVSVSAIPSQISLLGASCQHSIRVSICAAVYMKCTPIVSSNATITANVTVQRPCISVCTSIGDHCGKELQLFAPLHSVNNYSPVYWNCSGGLFGVASNLTAEQDSCNKVAADVDADISVAKPAEPYLHATDHGVCRKLVSGSVFIPDSRLINALSSPVSALPTIDHNGTAYAISIESGTLAPLWPPNMWQNRTEDAISSLLSHIPSFLSEPCQMAMREWLCASSMMAAQNTTLGKVLSSHFLAQGIASANVSALVNSSILAVLGQADLESTADNAPGAQAQSTLESLYDYPIMAPRYGARAVCTSYRSACSEFIAMAGGGLDPNCSATQPMMHLHSLAGSVSKSITGSSPSNVSTYSLQQQPVLEIALYGLSNDTDADTDAGAAVAVRISTAPFEQMAYSSSALVTALRGQHTVDGELEYRTECPVGFVVPAHPDNPRNQYIAPSGCVIPCQVPMYTPEEWAGFVTCAQISATTGLVLICLFLYTWLNDPVRRQQQMIICLGVIALGHSLVVTWAYSMSFQAGHCIDNSVAIDAFDGFNMCALQAFANLFATYAVLFCCFIHALDVLVKLDSTIAKRLYLTIGGEYSPDATVQPDPGTHTTKPDGDINAVYNYWKVYVPGVILLPLVLTSATFAEGKFGYEKGDITCVFTPDTHVNLTDRWDFWLFYIPIFVFLLAASAASGAKQLYLEYSRHFHMTTQRMQATLNSMSDSRRITAYHLWTLLLWTVIFITRISVYLRSPVYTSSFVDWIICVFSNFQGDSDSEQAALDSMCGTHPEVRLHPLHFNYFILATVGNSGFISIFYLVSSDVFEVWGKWGRRAVRKVGRALGFAVKAKPSTVKPLVLSGNDFDGITQQIARAQIEIMKRRYADNSMSASRHSNSEPSSPTLEQFASAQSSRVLATTLSAEYGDGSTTHSQTSISSISIHQAPLVFPGNSTRLLARWMEEAAADIDEPRSVGTSDGGTVSAPAPDNLNSTPDIEMAVRPTLRCTSPSSPQ